MSPTAVRRWITAAWCAAVLAAVLNGVVVGYGVVWFQLFGESADAEDYRISACGYGAAAGVLALGVVGILTHGAPRWLAWVAGTSSAVLALLALNSAASVSGVDVGARASGAPRAVPARHPPLLASGAPPSAEPRSQP